MKHFVSTCFNLRCFNLFLLAMAGTATTLACYSFQLRCADTKWNLVRVFHTVVFVPLHGLAGATSIARGYHKGEIKLAVLSNILCDAFRPGWMFFYRVIADIGYRWFLYRRLALLRSVLKAAHWVWRADIAGFSLLYLISAYVLSMLGSSFACWHFAQQRKVAWRSSGKLCFKKLFTAVTN